MSCPGDRLKEIIKDKKVSQAIATLLKLNWMDLVVVCAFFVKLHSNPKISSNYLG